MQHGQEQEAGELVPPWLVLKHQHGEEGASSHSGPQQTPTGWDFKAEIQKGSPGRGTAPSVRIASLVVLCCWKSLHWRPRTAAPWGFNLGQAQGLVARSPKRRTSNISKAGPSVRLTYPVLQAGCPLCAWGLGQHRGRNQAT